MSLQNDLDVLNTHLNGLLREADIAPATQGMRSAIADIKNHVHDMIFNHSAIVPEKPVDVVEDTIKYDTQLDEELAESPIEEPTFEAELNVNEDDSDDEFDSPTESVDDVVTTSVGGTDNDDAVITESSLVDSSGDISANSSF